MNFKRIYEQTLKTFTADQALLIMYLTQYYTGKEQPHSYETIYDDWLNDFGRKDPYWDSIYHDSIDREIAFKAYIDFVKEGKIK
jgi:hypothetical protein